MECMYAQTRLRFILSSERFWGGNGARTHVNSKGKIPSTAKNLIGEGSNPRRCIKQDREPKTLPTSYSGPYEMYVNIVTYQDTCKPICFKFGMMLNTLNSSV